MPKDKITLFLAHEGHLTINFFFGNPVSDVSDFLPAAQRHGQVMDKKLFFQTISSDHQNQPDHPGPPGPPGSLFKQFKPFNQFMQLSHLCHLSNLKIKAI